MKTIIEYLLALTGAGIMIIMLVLYAVAGGGQ